MDFLTYILTTGMTSSIFSIMIMLAKLMTKRIFSPKWHYYVQRVAILSFLLPLSDFILFPYINSSVFDTDYTYISDYYLTEVVEYIYRSYRIGRKCQGSKCQGIKYTW